MTRSTFQLHTAEVKSRVSHAKSDDRGGSGQENLQLDFLLNLYCSSTHTVGM